MNSDYLKSDAIISSSPWSQLKIDHKPEESVKYACKKQKVDNYTDNWVRRLKKMISDKEMSLFANQNGVETWDSNFKEGSELSTDLELIREEQENDKNELTLQEEQFVRERVIQSERLALLQ